MPSKKHDRQYDVVVFGATGYTGKYTAQHIAASLPTDLRWAVAGRSEDKLAQVVARCKQLNPDRTQPEIEICNLTDHDLAALAKKTFILITTVGPYGRLGEHAFKACAENGTHYLDVTGEVPYVAKMLRKHEAAARASGALMFPQIGIESAPSDLVTWSLARRIRADLDGARTADVTVSIHKMKSAPSGGTLSTVLTILDNFTLAELRAAYEPYAISPAKPDRPDGVPPSLVTRATGLVTVPVLGQLTSSLAATTDAAIVQRTWGLLSTVPSRQDQAYGPRFTWRQYMKPRNWLTGIAVHYGLMFFGLVLVTPFLRRLVAQFVTQPGDGPEASRAERDEIEYRGVAKPDLPGAEGKEAYCKAWFNGSAYLLTGILLAEAAATILEVDDLELPGGVYTAACLGQPFIDRLDRAGFHFETQMLDV